MKFFFQALAMVALLAGKAAAIDVTDEENGVSLSKTVGESLGTEFTDLSFVTPGQTVHSITIRTDKNVKGIGIDATSRFGHRVGEYHGGNTGTPKTLKLNAGERFQCFEAHWGPYHDHTRIMFIQITTTSGRMLEGGTRTANRKRICAPKDFQLGGFIGYAGVELNMVGVVWANNKVV